MKPLHGLMLLILACSLPVQVVAKSDREQSQAVRDVVHLIGSDFAPYRDQIAIQAAELTEAERQRVYGYTHKEVLDPFLLNTLLGFGFGSFVTGDWVTGYAEAAGELAGLSLAFGSNLVEGGLNSEQGKNMAITGLVMFLAARLFGMFEPVAQVPVYNAQLKEILGLETVEIQPYLNTASAGVQVAF